MSDWTYIDNITDHSTPPGDSANGARPQSPAHGSVDTAWGLGSVVANRFVLQSRLGRGRYGEVYEALDRSLSDPQMGQEHRVALHLLHDRIRDQTPLLQKLESSYLQPHSWAHPNVVKISGFGTDRGKYFLVMELLDGASLRFILDEASPDLVSRDEAFAVLRGVGDALKYAHAKGAVHGEIGPEKIFVTTDFVVKVLDLLPGSSARTVPFFVEDTATDGLAAPDPRDDVYGLACLAYELLSGRHPFNANSPLEAANAGLTPGYITGLDQRQWDALARGLALRRDQRIASVAEFLRELGITGSEKLRPPQSEPAPDVSNVSTAAARPTIPPDPSIPVVGDYSAPRHSPTDDFTPIPAAPPPRAQPRPQAQPFPARVHSQYADFEPHRSFAQYRERREPRRGFKLASLALVVALGVAAFLNYDLVRERTIDLFAGAASSSKDGAPGDTGRAGEANAVQEADTQTAAAAPQEPTAAVTAPAIAEVAPEEPQVPAATADAGPNSPPARADGADAVPHSPPAGSDAADLLPRSSPARSDAATVVPSRLPEQSGAPAVARADVSGPARFEFTTRSVTVSEGRAIAAVAIRRRGGGSEQASVVWWTSDGTATADDDYANFGRRVEVFDGGEEVRTVYIPIVVDSIAEPRESFYLNLGESQQPGRRLEPAERIEVVIVDDDA